MWKFFYCRFERQISVDQDGCLNADTVTPFQSKEDAVKRLIRYHCMYESTDEDPAELLRNDLEFERKASKFEDEFHGMLQKYQLLLMKESTVIFSLFYQSQFFYSFQFFYYSRNTFKPPN